MFFDVLLAMFIFGGYSLATGLFMLTGNRIAVGLPARIVGLVLVVPLPVSLAAGSGFTSLASGLRPMVGALLGRESTSPQNLELFHPVVTPLTIGCLLLALGIVLVTGKPHRLPTPVPSDEISPPGASEP